MNLTTRLTERYSLQTPIVLAGMAFAAMTPPLGIAVSEAGAMGSIAGVGILPPEAVRMLVGGMQAGTDKAFHVNFISCYTTDAHIALMCEMKPRAVSFHWGHPSRTWIDSLHAAGIDVWEQVGSVAAAKLAVADGVELVIAQGSEAGGHNFGTAGTMALTPAIVDAVGGQAMVLAAGGIADGRGLAAALMLGADGAWIGSRFVATQEASVADAYKARLVHTGCDETQLTHLFGRHHPDFNPIRVVRTALVAQWSDKVEQVAPGDENHPQIGQMELLGQPTPLHRFTNLVPMTGATGDIEEMAMLCGQGVELIRDVPGAAQLVQQMTDQAGAAIARRYGA